MKTIEKASLFKRIVAAGMDALLAVFVFFMLISYVTTPIAKAASPYQTYALEIYQQEVASHLYMMLQQNRDGDYVVIEVKDYTEKLTESSFKKIYPAFNIESVSNNDLIRYLDYYYTVYMAGDASRVELPTTMTSTVDDYLSPYAKTPIDGKMPSEIYTARFFNVQIMGLSPEGEVNQSLYYDYPIKDEHIDYEGVPVIKADADANNVKKDLRERMYKATKDFFYSDYINSRQSKIKSIQLWSEIPVYVFVIGVFYLLIPMLMKNGETLGKKTLNIGVVSTNGYQVKKKQILFRSLVFIVEITFSLFIVGYGLTSFATLGVGCVLMMAVAVFTKKNQAPHDLAAMTIEIDMKKSVFFENAKEEKKYTDQVDENISQLNKFEPENPNIIQVGGTIIKDEFKPKKKKNSNPKSREK